MLPSVKYRSVILFLLLRNFDRQAISNELSAAYGDDTPCQATVYDWIREFQNGRTDVMDRKSTGRPIELGDDHRDKVHKIVLDNRRISKKELAEQLNLSCGSAVSMKWLLKWSLESCAQDSFRTF